MRLHAGVGGLFAIVFYNYFGRFPTTFYFLFLSTAMAVYCAVAPDYNHFMAARILDGLFSTVTQSGGLVFIQDMFFFHEHVCLPSPRQSCPLTADVSLAL
jgi:predicted MFS family arabinose efflux permease